jgi:hypothetical protein
LTLTVSAPAGVHTLQATFEPEDKVHYDVNTADFTATDTITVTNTGGGLAPPTLGESFSPQNVPTNVPATLTFTVGNPNASASLSGVGFTDVLPAGLQVAAAANATNNCGGIFAPNPGGTSLTFSGANLVASTQCSLSVAVSAATAGTYTNTTSPISSNEAGSGQSASAALSVVVGAGSRSTSTTLSLAFVGVTSAQPLGAPAQTSVMVTVTDTDSGTAVTPGGAISFTDASSPANSDTFGRCTLAQGANRVGIASCTTTLTLTFPLGLHTVVATYMPSDGAHQGSNDRKSSAVIALISDDPAGDGAGGDTSTPSGLEAAMSVSATGRYVSFASYADNLTASPLSNQPPQSGKLNVFLRDTCVGVAGVCTPRTQEVSVDDSGNELGYGAPGVAPLSGDSANVSGDGSIVVFNSYDASLSLPTVYTRQVCGASGIACPSTAPQSFDANGNRIAGQHGVMSRNGRYIAFSAPPVGGAGANGPIYLRDTCVGAPAGCAPTTNPQLVNLDNTGQPTSVPGTPGAVSDDGRFVLFSDASASLPGANGAQQLYLRDMSVLTPPNPGQTIVYLISCNSSAPCAGGASGGAQSGSMSADGRFVSFTASGLLDANVDVYVRDTCLGSTAPNPCTPATSKIAAGTVGSPFVTSPFAIDATGRFVTVSYTPSSSPYLVDTCRLPNSPVSASCTLSMAPLPGSQASTDSNAVPISGDGNSAAWISFPPSTGSGSTQQYISATR